MTPRNSANGAASVPEVQRMPLVSIGIPTYRRPEFLRRAMASALAQDYANIEVIVSDNASGDETESVCFEICESDPRVRYIQQTANLGPVRNFAAVLAVARGEFFMWLADDDWIDVSYVRHCVSKLVAFPEIVIAGGASHNYRDGEWVESGKPMNLLHSNPARRVAEYYLSVGDNCVFYGLMRREMLSRCHLTNTLGGDWLLIAQAAFQGKVVTVPGIYLHRERIGGTAESIAKIVQTLQLPRVQQIVPVTSIAVAAFREVFRAHAVFASLDRPKRYALAVTVAGIVFVRWGVWARLKKFLIWLIGIDRSRRLKAAVLDAVASLFRIDR